MEHIEFQKINIFSIEYILKINLKKFYFPQNILNKFSVLEALLYIKIKFEFLYFFLNCSTLNLKGLNEIVTNLNKKENVNYKFSQQTQRKKQITENHQHKMKLIIPNSSL